MGNSIRCMLLLLWVALASEPLSAQTTPTTRPARERTTVVTTQPVAIPYQLTETNHILIRLKINGQGPFNFIVDTGSPVMILRVPVAEKLGLKPNSRGMAIIRQLDIEGGMTLKHVSCLVDTPYQIEGMNAIGASAVDLDGLLGYAVLARFRMQIDLTKDRMIWTPLKYSPPVNRLIRTSERSPDDSKEDRLESVGGLLKLLGPLIKPNEMESKYRGVIGLELAETPSGITVQRVLGDSPAEKAGVRVGDQITTIGKKPVRTIAEAQAAMAETLAGQDATLVLERDHALMTLHLVCAEGL